MKDNSQFFNIARDSEFLIESFKLNQSFKVEGKKRIRETICSTMVIWYVVIPSCNGLLTPWNEINNSGLRYSLFWTCNWDVILRESSYLCFNDVASVFFFYFRLLLEISWKFLCGNVKLSSLFWSNELSSPLSNSNVSWFWTLEQGPLFWYLSF